jgi:K+-sensing histidine kinase KdpD
MHASSSETTHFAPPGRDTDEELRRRERLVQGTPLLRAILDAMSQMVVILNEHRQVVAANRCVLGVLDADGAPLVGRRPGELFGCTHASDGPDGCGTAECCATCGAVEAILECRKAQSQVTRECRLNVAAPAGSRAIDLKVTATPVSVDGESFTVCAIDDISAQKRLAVLTRMFFHDVLNTAGGIRGYVQLLTEATMGQREHEEDCRQLAGMTDQLIEEIQSQRDLMYAESGELAVYFQPLRTADFLAGLHAQYELHPMASVRRVVLRADWEGEILTDGRLLTRVLGNMLKNALEAAEPGDAVTLRCEDREAEVEFSVHNPGTMPQHVQLQIFQRSFSTKGGAGRGIGTHSMKLLGERYLGGKVDFTSTDGAGTTFRLRLPKRPHDHAS